MNLLSPVKTKEEEIVEYTTEQIVERVNQMHEESMKDSSTMKSLDLETIISFSKKKKISTQDYHMPTTTRLFRFSRNTYERSKWDYEKIDKFVLREPYLARMLDRHVETMLRNGFKFVSENPEYLKIVNGAMSRIAREKNKYMDTVIGEMAVRLKKHGMFFTIVNRETIKYKKEDVRVISDIKFVHPSKVTVRMDTGEVKGYLVMDWFKYFKKKKNEEISPRDMFFCTAIDNSEEFFPTPPAIGSFNDVLTVRSIEETVELFCFQFGSPLLHAKVGTDQREGTDAEVANVHNQIVRMAPNGFITTTNRTQIEVISIQKIVANLSPILEYFKTRLLAGIGISPVSLGEGDTSNRSTADSIESALSDNCARVANIICDFFNTRIIPDILIAHGIPDSEIYDDNYDPVVYLDFNEMRMEKQTQHENHIMNLWNSNAITYEEYRELLQKPKLNDKEIKRIKFYMMGNDNNKTANYTNSTTNPSNQHGKKNEPGSVKN